MATVEKNDRQDPAAPRRIERFLRAAIERIRGTDRSLTIERCPACQGQAAAVDCPLCHGEGFVDLSATTTTRAADSLHGRRA